MRPFTSTISIDEARRRLAASVLPITRTEPVPLAEAAGRVAACDIAASVEVPPFARSAMDGYGLAPDHRLQHVVDGIGRGRDHDPVQAPGPGHSLDLAHDQRRPGQRHRRPARQAFGTHAGLEDGEDQRRPTRQATGEAGGTMDIGPRRA